MLDETFARAFSHDLPRDYNEADPWSNHRVLGRRVRPYCLWHNFLLETIESPLLAGKPPTHLDIARAASIFRSRFRQWPIVTRLNVFDLYHFARKGMAGQIELINDYITDFNSQPEYSVKTATSPNPNATKAPALIVGHAPEVFRMASEMIGWSGWSDRKVWEMPLSEVYWYLAQALREHCMDKGADVDFMTPEHREMQRQMREAGIK